MCIDIYVHVYMACITLNLQVLTKGTLTHANTQIYIYTHICICVD